MVADDPSQGIVFDDPRGKIEDDGPQTGHNAHQDGQAEQAGLDADPCSASRKTRERSETGRGYWLIVAEL